MAPCSVRRAFAPWLLRTRGAAAGVGLDHHDESMAGLVARGLSQRHRRPAEWTVIGLSGATVGDVRDLLRDLLDAVLAAAPRADVLLFGIPPMDRLPALPRPLADFMGARSREFNRIGREMAALRSRIRRVDGELEMRAECFAGDGIHPSAALHRRFAEAVLSALEPEILDPEL